MTKRNTWQGWTADLLLDKKKAGLIDFDESQISVKVEKKKRSKYGNKKTEVDGIRFDSEREAKRYKQLLLLQKAGEIGLLRRQVDYELNEGGTHSLKYRADFVYMTKDGVEVVEDSKGCRTREYLKKRRLMKSIYGIEIKEV